LEEAKITTMGVDKSDGEKRKKENKGERKEEKTNIHPPPLENYLRWWKNLPSGGG
jgi:hypothetical protein